MALRIFAAPDGTEWRVWKVVPSLALDGESREWERRGQDVLAFDGPERRQGERRNATPFVSPRLSGGWLCFESGNGKRRLAPPPRAWEDAPDDELARFWEKAEPVAQRKIQIPGLSLHRLP
ncbi:MAG: hypothetical protein KY467_03775 [Gemmatimonadetes bacterium]|nr:hypothetical protein [Gemmatimonadota bacterium]